MPPITHLLWQLIRYAQRLYWIDTLLWLFILGLPAVPGLIIREFFNTLTGASRFGASSWVWIGLLLAVGLARVVAIFVGRITKTQHRFLISGLVRHNLLHELLKRPGAELATGGINGYNVSPGEILSYFRDDAAQIEDVVVGTNEIFAAGVFAVGSVALLISVNPTMTLLVFLPLCAIMALAHKAEHRLKYYRYASRHATQRVTGLIGELLTAVQAVKVAGAESQMLEELRERCDRRRDLMVRDQIFNAILNSGFENIVSLGTGLILLLAAQSLGTRNNLTVGDFALFIYYLAFVTDFFASCGIFLASIKQSEVSFERMAGLTSGGGASRQRGKWAAGQVDDTMTTEIVKFQPSSGSPTHPLTHPRPLYLKPIFGSQPAIPSYPQRTTDEPLRELRVERLCYHYPNSTNGICDISFTLRRGSLTVITGQVGAGKTTLLRVLLGLLPRQSGQLFWNATEINDPDNFLVPPYAAYTPQIPQLFSASLRENLLLGLELTENQAQLEQAIATAIFDQELATMPEGLDTLIGTRGFRLSGGQKQRIAAARMLIRQAELLVFDDLSSALDVETEQHLWQKLFEGRRVSEVAGASGGDLESINKDQGAKSREEADTHYPAPNTEIQSSQPLPPAPTCLVVTHRPAVLNLADWVIFLDTGAIRFAGKPADLLKEFPNFQQATTLDS